MGLPFVCLAAHGFRASSMARGSDFGKCQTFAASPAEPGELPLWFRMRLAEGRTELEAASAPATQLGAIQSLEDTVLAAGLASAVTGCIVSAATCKRAVGASVALYQSGLASNVGDNAQASTQAQTEMNILDAMLQSIQTQITDNVASASDCYPVSLWSEVRRLG